MAEEADAGSPVAGELTETQRLFNKCMQQDNERPQKGFKLFDGSEDLIAVCEGYTQSNSCT